MLKEYDPIFGKNVIETLSEGMYDNPLFLYREYVQNAADAIDAAVAVGCLSKEDAQIQVSIDHKSRKIVFEDNGIGISHHKVASVLANIGASQKDRLKNKGFRGIGRLGGLGYCRLVRFETSAVGESVTSILEWDAEKLHKILFDQSEQIDAGELIKRITTVSSDKCDKDLHFFRVSLIDVNESSEDLMDVDDVRKYLSMVAPAPFDYQKFCFVSELEDFVRTHDLPPLQEYQIYLNGDEIRKGYETPLVIDGNGKSVEILGVESHLLCAEKKVIGWYWFCISRFEGVLPKGCWQRCIRLRKDNIQIGEADCLSNHPKRGQALWKEDRGNNYFLGEIHVLDKELIPNSRRDYFNQDDACRRFEAVLTTEFLDLNRLYHEASAYRSSVQTVQKANAEIRSFKERDKSNAFFDEQEREAALKKVQEGIAKAEKAQRELAKMNQAHDDPAAPAVKVFGAYATETPHKIENVPARESGRRKEFAKDSMASNTQRVLEKVFAVVDAVLPPDDAKLLRAAIMKRFERK